jgi:hypothetical protein
MNPNISSGLFGLAMMLSKLGDTHENMFLD